MPDPYISEVKFLGAGNQDFVEIALDAGTDPSTIQLIVYHPSGSVRTTNDLGSPDGTMAGKDIYSIDSANSGSFNGVHKNGAVALVENGTVIQFISFEREVTATNGPAAGMTSTELGGTGNGESLETTDGGGSYGIQTAPSKGTIPCFLSGTFIQTPDGVRAVEHLAPGDLVLTADGGAQQVLWVGRRQLTLDEASDPQSRPIRIPARALGPGRPAHDTYVSPNHRVLVSDVLCRQLFDCAETFVAAKFLIGFKGIGHAPVALPVQFHHILLKDHHVLFANGLGAESLFHGDMASEGFAAGQTDLSADLSGFAMHERPARRVLKAREAELLVQAMSDLAEFQLKVS